MPCQDDLSKLAGIFGYAMNCGDIVSLKLCDGNEFAQHIGKICAQTCGLCNPHTAPRKCGGFIAEKCPRGFRCSIFPPTKLSARRGLAAMFGKCVLDNSQRLVTKDQSTNDTLILMMVVVMFFCSCCVLLWFRNRQKEIARKQKGSSYVLMQD